jgi:hypothetical protein
VLPAPIAIHESGHALAAELLGYAVHSVLLRETGGGATWLADQGSIPARFLAVIFGAGAAAEALTGSPGAACCARDDRRAVARMRHRWSTVTLAAADILVPKLSDLEALAAELERARELTGARCRQILEERDPVKVSYQQTRERLARAS